MYHLQATGDDMRAKVYYLKHTYIRIYRIYMVKHLRGGFRSSSPNCECFMMNSIGIHY